MLGAVVSPRVFMAVGMIKDGATNHEFVVTTKLLKKLPVLSDGAVRAHYVFKIAVV
jgi:hypothetical protein